MLATGVGEIRRVALDDGTELTLDTATKVEVELGKSHRRAWLRSGRARFAVAKASGPFVVEAGGITAAANDAVMDVDLARSEPAVQVLAGRADIRRAGSRAAVSGAEVRTPASGARPGTAERADWTRGFLQFDQTPLGAAVARANNYSRRHILLEGDVAKLRVTGAFRSGDTAGLAKGLAEAFHLSIARTSRGDLVLSRAGSAEPAR